MGIFAVDGKLAVFLNRLGSLIVLNLLTVVCCIPVITAGAAMTALYSMTLRLTRGEEEQVAGNYLKAFRDNFKQATLLWLIGGGILLFMAFDIWLLRSLTGTFGQVYRIILFVLLLFFVMVLIHAFAVLARFDNTTRNTVKNALLFCAGHIGPACLMVAVALIPVILLTVSWRFLSVGILIGISGPAYLESMYFTPLFRTYEGDAADEK